MTEEQLSALLRLKRFEQPPEGYFDGLLRDIHRRQREELLSRPLWKIAVERLQTFFGEHSMSPMAYGGAMAGVMVAGAMTFAFVSPRGPSAVSGGALAEVKFAPKESASQFTLQPQPGADALTPQWQLVAPRTAFHSPRYVIDARPVSYDASSLRSF